MDKDQLKPHLDRFGPYLRVQLGLIYIGQAEDSPTAVVGTRGDQRGHHGHE